MHIKSIVAIFMLIIIFASCRKSNSSASTCTPYTEPPDTYKYPILPGTPAWVALGTTEARWQACQVPADILQATSTAGLAESWLTMPLNNELFSGNSLQKSMEYFIENFSGLKELVKRNDAAEKMFERYKLLNTSCVESYSNDADKGAFTFLFTYAGILMAQDTIINQMKAEQRKQVVAEAIKKIEEQQKYYDVYGKVGLESCCFICARVMYNSRYELFLTSINPEIQWFLDNAQFQVPAADHSREVNIIIQSAKNFIY